MLTINDMRNTRFVGAELKRINDEKIMKMEYVNETISNKREGIRISI